MEEIRTPILPLQLRARTDGIMFIIIGALAAAVGGYGQSCKRHKLDALSVVGETINAFQRTALPYAPGRERIDAVRALFAVDHNGKTPFDSATRSNSVEDTHEFLIACYGNKLTHEHGRLAVHVVLRAADYAFAEDDEFHPPVIPLRIRLPLGAL
jgi:hypothetical protein